MAERYPFIPVRPSQTLERVRRGFMVVGAAAAACVVLLVAFFFFRPLNLTPAAAELASVIEEVLLDSEIAGDVTIERAVSAEQQGPNVVWSRYELTVELPQTTDRLAVEEYLRRQMALRNIGVAPTATDSEDAMQMRFLVDGRELVLVRFYGGEWTEPTPEVAAIEDQIADCERIVNEVRVILAQNAVPTNTILQTVPEIQEEDGLRWQWSRIVVQAPHLVEPGELADEIETTLRQDERIDVASIPHEDPGVIQLAIRFDDRDCLELLLAGPQAGPLSLEEDAPESTTPEAVPDAPEEEISQQGAAREAVAEPIRIAIIVDDGGYGGPATEAMLAIEAPLTLSIFPSTPFSRETAEEAVARGFEVMMHAPMESYNSRGDLPDSLRVSMPADEIQAITAAWLDGMPMAVGVNNHTGSKFTASEEAMRAFMSVLAERGVYFVDSRTHVDTIAHEVALASDVPARPRDLFLDNEPNGDSIREHIDELIVIAREHGSAIGICHFREKTATVLEGVLPELAERGVELVFASELIPDFSRTGDPAS